jgi:hypothetical protein
VQVVVNMTASNPPQVTIAIAGPHERPECAQAYRRWNYDGTIAPADCVLYARSGVTLIGVVRLAPEHGVLVLRGMQVAPQVRGLGSGGHCCGRRSPRSGATPAIACPTRI